MGDKIGVYRKDYFSNGVLQKKCTYNQDHIEIVVYFDNSNMELHGKTTEGLKHFSPPPKERQAYIASGYFSLKEEKKKKCTGSSYFVDCTRWNKKGDKKEEIKFEFCFRDIF